MDTEWRSQALYIYTKLVLNRSLRNYTKARENNPLIGSSIVFQRTIPCEFCCQMRRWEDSDGTWNAQNHRIWTSSRAEGKEKDAIKMEQKFPRKMRVQLGVYFTKVTFLVIFDRGTIDHSEYVENVLSVSLEYCNEVLTRDRMLQQDDAKTHIDRLTQQRSLGNFSSFIYQHHWPPNSSHSKSLEYCIRDAFTWYIVWNKVTSRETLINERKRAVKWIR